jgi:transposase
MDELIKMLDNDLRYIRHELIGDTFYIYVESESKEAICPFCKSGSTRVHSVYERSFQDLPMQGKKVIIVLLKRKLFCENSDCSHTTFGERYSFIREKAKKTNRLEDEIVRVALNCSSVAASEILKQSVVDVGKSTICSLLKKRRENFY